MAKTVVGYFDNFRQAENAVDELTRDGFRREDISIIANQEARRSTTRVSGSDKAGESDAGTGAAVGATTGAVVGGAAGLIASLAGLTIPVVGPILAAGPIVAMLSGAGVGAVAGGLIGALVNLGVPEEEARVYEEAVKRGGTLVTLKAEDARAQAAADIMNRHGAVDIKQRATQWRQGQPAAAAAPYGTATAGSTTTTRSNTMQGNQHTNQDTEKNFQAKDYEQNRKEGEEIRVPVVEEELRVGKREVETGGVRVEQKVTEKPVREEIELHEEKVNVQRRPADRPATAADIRQPGEQSFEVRETREEAVVQKGARVVEDVVVSKEGRDRTQMVEDKVRRKDVEVHEISGGHRGDSDYSMYENDFRTYHTRNFANTGSTYDQWSPAYRYGHSLAGDQRYRGKDWNTFESDARRDWESRNPGTWDRMKDAVRYGWERVRQGAHNATH